jgi:glucose/arabinose dehydrogenase
MKLKKIAASIAAMAFAAGVVAKENDVGIFGTSGKGMGDHTFIAQDGPKADNIRNVLKNVKMPAGFKIELYAIVPDARDMAMAPQGTVLFVGTRKDKVWVVSDRDRDGVADEVKDFAPSLDFDVPNGVQFSKDGFLYIAERNHVRVFPAAEFFFEGPDVVAVDVVPKGELIPEGEESYNHTARVVDIGPDNKLYISLGQPYNVAPRDKMDLYKKTGIGGIIRMDRDGKNREVFTYGVRNSVGQDFHPVTGELWWTDNQVDGMGDDIPPGELNRQTKAGQHFGHPWFGGGKTRVKDEGYDKDIPPAGIVHPAVETTAHCADLGMAFYTGNQFPSKYKNAIFSAQHGSWNRTEPCGARVMVTFIDKDGKAKMEPFAEGWLNANKEYDGRPMSITMMKDGSMLVSDDYAGAIYKISYVGS